MILPLYVLEEIDRYLGDYAWEWRTISKVINFKHGYHFEPEEMEKAYRRSLGHSKREEALPFMGGLSCK